MSEANSIRSQMRSARARIINLGDPERSAIGLHEIKEITEELCNIEEQIQSAYSGTSVLMDVCKQLSKEMAKLRKNLHINISDAIALGNCSAPKGCLKLVRTWH